MPALVSRRAPASSRRNWGPIISLALKATKAAFWSGRKANHQGAGAQPSGCSSVKAEPGVGICPCRSDNPRFCSLKAALLGRQEE